MKVELSGQIFKNTHISRLMEIQREPSCSMRTDGQTLTKLIVAFCNFANAPTNE